MSVEAQRIVDELAVHARNGAAQPYISPELRDRILAAATRKPKHPTPDKFFQDGDDLRDYLETLVADGFLTNPYAAIHRRQLDAANHAIAHLRRVVYSSPSGLPIEAHRFIKALDNGDDFPEMPK